MEAILIGPTDDPLHALLTDEGYRVRRTLVKGTSLVLIRASQCLDPEVVRRVRVSLGPKGRVYVACPATHAVSSWLFLRHAGLEPKKTVFIYPALDAPAMTAVVVAHPAKRGGLTIDALFS